MNNWGKRMSLFGMLSLIAISFSACIEAGPDLEERLTEGNGKWDIVDHCSIGFEYQFSFVEFNDDRTGVFQVYDDCVVGYECKHWMTFRWTLREEEEELAINFRTDQTVQICEEIQDSSIWLDPEVISFNAETERITIRGYTFEKD